MVGQCHELVVPLRIREAGREERTSPILVNVSIENDSQTASRQQLMCFRLTDESDPFFLYFLRITEEEFQSVKAEQCILVDFAEFPSKFTELLECCATAASESPESPKFSASLSACGGSTYLAIVETNQFKHLTHLRLEFRGGTDAAIKQYLAKELSRAKSEREQFRAQLDDHIKMHKSYCDEARSSLVNAREAMEIAQRDLNEVKLNHASTNAQLREHAALQQQQLQAQFDADKREIAREYAAKENSLAKQLEEQREKARKLEDERNAQESSLRETTSKFQAAEHSLALSSEEVIRLREEIKSSERIRFQQEKELQANAVRLSTLEQIVIDGKAMSTQLQQLVESAQGQKEATEESLRMVRYTSSRNEEKLRMASSEISKGNEIIERLQDELNTLKTKLKMKNAVIIRQEQVVNEKDKIISEKELEIKILQQTIAEKDGANEILQSKLKQETAKLSEAENTLQSNKQIIAYLNKEVNEAQSGRGPFSTSQGLWPSSLAFAAEPRESGAQGFSAGIAGGYSSLGKAGYSSIGQAPLSRYTQARDPDSDQRQPFTSSMGGEGTPSRPPPPTSSMLASSGPHAFSRQVEYRPPSLSGREGLAVSLSSARDATRELP